MSPTTDDLRTLLERRADATPPALAHPEAVGARLAGVQAKVRQRRRARAAAATLSLALLAGSAALVTTELRQRHAAPQPARFPDADNAGRPLATTLSSEGLGPHDATARLAARWADLHLVVRCAGSPEVLAVALVDGREVARTACGAQDRDVVVTSDQARGDGLRTDQPATVGVHLARRPAPGQAPSLAQFAVLPDAHGELAVYTAAKPLPLPPVPQVNNPGQFEPGTHVLLGSLTLPVTRDIGEPSFTVVPGTGRLVIYVACTTSRGGPAYTLELAVNGHSWPITCDETAATGGDDASWASKIFGLGPADGQDENAYWRSRGVVAGRPTTIAFRLAPSGTGQHPPDRPLARDLPGARVGVTVYGVPVLAPATRAGG